MQLFTDQMQRQVVLEHPPRRIVSLVPSQTELLYALGLREEVVGITKFCVHPAEWFRTKKRVGGTKQLHLEQIAALQPDLIIGNKEENERVQIEALAEKFPVWMSDIQTLDDALQMILHIGELVNKTDAARQLTNAIQQNFSTLPKPEPPLRAVYFIWQNPYMIAGNATFIHEMLQRAGFDNAFKHLSRYPEITLDELVAANPEVILLSSEPYPFKDQHFAMFQQVCPLAVVQLVDGELFSWYGSRLLHSAAYFRRLYQDITHHLKK
ncbi:MAG: ABC transporter substrate-binding protein [Saprospiraceae bacterium]